MEEVINKIFDKQLELEMNNTEFAKFLGVSRQWVTRLHNKNAEKRPFRFKVMCILCHACGIPMEELKRYNTLCEKRKK